MSEPTETEKFLWELLDDISTAGDRFKPDLGNGFVSYVLARCERRGEVIHSPDGFALVYTASPDIEGVDAGHLSLRREWCELKDTIVKMTSQLEACHVVHDADLATIDRLRAAEGQQATTNEEQE